MMRSERDLVAECGRRLLQERLVVSTFGNASLRQGDTIAITPSDVEYRRIDADAVCLVDLNGKQLSGRYLPSSELPLHLALYDALDVKAVVHTHSPFATAVACAGVPLPFIHCTMRELGGAVPVIEFVEPGTQELGSRVVDALLPGTSAVLLQGHGTVIVGQTLQQALHRGLVLEAAAEIFTRARQIGAPQQLPDPLLVATR